MTKVKIKAVTSFSHGNLDATMGGTYSLNKGDAQELEKIGLAEIVTGDDTEEPEQPDPADLLGDDDEKAAEPVENKMESAPENKAAPKTATKKTK